MRSPGKRISAAAKNAGEFNKRLALSREEI